jgi:hypothetical protein
VNENIKLKKLLIRCINLVKINNLTYSRILGLDNFEKHLVIKKDTKNNIEKNLTLNYLKNLMVSKKNGFILISYTNRCFVNANFCSLFSKLQN